LRSLLPLPLLLKIRRNQGRGRKRTLGQLPIRCRLSIAVFART
jgi:hypothetical protein